MKRMLFNATYQEELRVATVDGQKLINFDIETANKAQRRGNIYKGVVTRVENSLEACFVNYGTDKHGFLPFKEIDSKYLSEKGTQGRDSGRLSVGTELIIQVEKDERGNKGAALTTYISLPGRYLVLMPNNSRSGGISRRIEGDERDELKSLLSQLEMPNGMSIIARTAALGRAIEELQWDLNYLTKLWDAVLNAANSKKGSFLIYQESSLVIRSIRDHFSPDIAEILVDMEDIYEQARDFILHVMPTFAARIKLYKNDIPLFSRFQVEHQIETAYSRAVNLPSGGAIVIDHSEALTAIDVNSAKSNKGSDIEATAYTTNLEAAEEIARQLRLRDLGGLIVVDFIDMENQRNQRELENFFKAQLSLDRARIQMGKLSRFGLLELSRQRLQSSLGESTTISCPRCSGVGTIRGTESNAVHVLRIIQEEVVKNSNYITALHVQLPIPVATYLLNEKREDVARIESRVKVKIVIIPNVHLESPQYKIRKISSDTEMPLSRGLSYTLVDLPDDSQILGYQAPEYATADPDRAAVRNIVTQQAPTVHKKRFLKRMLEQLSKVFHSLGAKKKLRGNSKKKQSNGRSQFERSNTRNQKSSSDKTKPIANKAREGKTSRNNKVNKASADKLSSDNKKRPYAASMTSFTPEVELKNMDQMNNEIANKIIDHSELLATSEPKINTESKPKLANVDLGLKSTEVTHGGAVSKDQALKKQAVAATKLNNNDGITNEKVTVRQVTTDEHQTKNTTQNVNQDSTKLSNIEEKSTLKEVEKPALKVEPITLIPDLQGLELINTNHELFLEINAKNASLMKEFLSRAESNKRYKDMLPLWEKEESLSNMHAIKEYELVETKASGGVV